MLVMVLRPPWKSVLTKPLNKFHGFQQALKIIVPKKELESTKKRNDILQERVDNLEIQMAEILEMVKKVEIITKQL
ncbi:hypothetical protein COU54_05705 [Candidatus Pacearchaeota archaeon CG10_big_fil_rev_8_21_14_0_10_31_24]|nr:MAG: hypothetical protein COU54_05705 [Candidatus Pacearchaeota archaeon CG10_big_fil_rev_8_21_14_0_10_31_24]